MTRPARGSAGPTARHVVGGPRPNHSCIGSRPLSGQVVEAALASLAFSPAAPSPLLSCRLIKMRQSLSQPLLPSLQGLCPVGKSRRGGARSPFWSCPEPLPSGKQGVGCTCEWPGSLRVPALLIFLRGWRKGRGTLNMRFLFPPSCPDSLFPSQDRR